MQNLRDYCVPPHWSVGRPWPIYVLWFFLGSPFLACRFLPGSTWRIYLLKLFGSRICSTCRLKPVLRVKFPWRLRVGSYCWLGEDVWIDNLAVVTFGDNVCISQGVYICTGNHDFKSSSFDLNVRTVSVDSDAWVAARSVIAPGTSVGFAAVIGLGSVVNGSVPSFAVMRGNPAIFIKDRRQ